MCGGDGIADGACDCDGNVEDALGVCGGGAADEDRTAFVTTKTIVGQVDDVAFAMERHS